MIKFTFQYDVEYGNVDSNGNNKNNNDNGNQQRRRSNGSQMARNLATYCENQNNNNKSSSSNVSTTTLKTKQITNSGDLKNLNSSSSSSKTMTIYDYYDNNSENINNILIGRSKTLPWPTNNNITNVDEPEGINHLTPKLSAENKHSSIASLFTSPNDGQVNFTKKRRNRMHNDSAAAIALNRSGLLQLIAHDSNNGVDENNLFNTKDNKRHSMTSAKPSPNALLSYYEKMTNINNTNHCNDLNNDDNGDFKFIDHTNNDDVNNKRTHQNSPETSSGDSIIIDNYNNNPIQTMAHSSSTTEATSPPIVVYNQRTAL